MAHPQENADSHIHQGIRSVRNNRQMRSQPRYVNCCHAISKATRIRVGLPGKKNYTKAAPRRPLNLSQRESFRNEYFEWSKFGWAKWAGLAANCALTIKGYRLRPGVQLSLNENSPQKLGAARPVLQVPCDTRIHGAVLCSCRGDGCIVPSKFIISPHLVLESRAGGAVGAGGRRAARGGRRAARGASSEDVNSVRSH
ncbi:hypothetical protein EVAR_77187_1 [Eumeta japonica]|uniref:Uncharacterized protein n=1 Tax=Eumeta variegata TaxID=151549 RepID=A0A4C1T4W9_EUMVA|nr:hypothetical protein EVAR_77187_1 [Eumeta japonica]